MNSEARSGRTGALRVSVTGIDGAGKDTVTLNSLSQLSARHGVSAMKLGRPTLRIHGGLATEQFGRTTQCIDELHARANASGDPMRILAANALGVIVQSRLIEPSGVRAGHDIIASSRDPNLDPMVYFDFYGSAVAKWIDYRVRAGVIRNITGVHRDLVVLLQVDPETAMERIESRLSTQAEAQSAAGIKPYHPHESVRILSELSQAYEDAIASVRGLGNTSIVRVDTNDKSPEAVTSEVSNAIWSSYNERVGHDAHPDAA